MKLMMNLNSEEYWYVIHILLPGSVGKGSIHSFIHPLLFLHSNTNRAKMEEIIGRDLPRDGTINLLWISWRGTIQNSHHQFLGRKLPPLLPPNEKT